MVRSALSCLAKVPLYVRAHFRRLGVGAGRVPLSTPLWRQKRKKSGFVAKFLRTIAQVLACLLGVFLLVLALGNAGLGGVTPWGVFWGSVERFAEEGLSLWGNMAAGAGHGLGCAGGYFWVKAEL